MSSRCYCPACRARDERRFWRTINANYSPHERRTLQRAVLFPPIPVWEGEPAELTLGRNRP